MNTSLRFYALMAAVMIYAGFGSPTPDHPGLVEALVGGLLVVAVGPSSFFETFRPVGGRPFWYGAGQVLLLYGLSVPLLTGALHGYGAGAIVRDVAPFLFMLLPLLAYDIFQRRPRYFRFYLAGIIGLGLAFSVRAIAPILGDPVMMLFKLEGRELYYFANMPSVLFAALFLIGRAGILFMRPGWRADWWRIALYDLAVLLPLCAMGLMLQRASLGVVALYGAGILGMAFYRAPLRSLVLSLIIAIALYPAWADIGAVIESMIYKTQMRGFNMRLEEWRAVWAAVSSDPLNLAFGLGWGASFESPAVGLMRVGFTHSLLSSMILKTGLMGLAAVGLYLLALGRLALKLLPSHPILIMALGAPVLIDALLYASYKSLDFGLVLLLLTGYAGFRMRKPQKFA